MTNHHTQFLEKTFSKDILDAGLQLFEKGVVKSLISSNFDFVTAIVKDGKSYEVEVSFPFNPKQKAHCSCATFTRLGFCKHITAVLYDCMVNANSKTAKSGKSTRSAPKSSQPSATLHVGQILDVLSLDELKAFVKRYARTDRKFDIQFKAAFASKIEWEDNTDKYRRILNNIVPPTTGSKPKLLSQTELKTVLTILDIFAGQINDSIALEQYRSALNQFEPSFSKILYLFAQNLQCQKELMPLFKTYHEIAYAFLQVKLPPELRNECVNLLIDFGNRSYYLHNDIYNNIWFGMEPFLRKVEKQKVESRIVDLMAQRPGIQKVVLTAVYLCYLGKFTKTVYQIIQKNHISFVEVSDKLNEIQQIGILASMLDFLKSQGSLHKELQHRHLLVYVALQDFQNLGKEVKRLFSESGDMKYLSFIKETVSPDFYTSWSTDLEFSLLKTASDPSIVITFYKFEKNWPGLLIYLERLNDTDLLMEHDAILLREEKEAMTELWMSIIVQQIKELQNDHNLRSEVVHRIEQYAKHFRAQKMDSIRRKVHTFLTKSYSTQLDIIAFFA